MQYWLWDSGFQVENYWLPKVWNIKLMLFNCRIIFLPEPAQQFWGHGCPVAELQQGVQHVPLLRLPRHLALPLRCRDVLLLHAAAHSGRGTHGPGHSVYSHFLEHIKCMLIINNHQLTKKQYTLFQHKFTEASEVWNIFQHWIEELQFSMSDQWQWVNDNAHRTICMC